MNVIYPAIRSAVYPAVRGALDISEKKKTSEQIIQSLFAQGQQGFWLPFTDFASLSQDAAGTLPYTALEQPVGLILDKSKGGGLGPELSPNGGTFDDAAGWTITQPTSSISGGVLNVGAGACDIFPSTASVVAGKSYEVTFTISNSTANYGIRILNRDLIGTGNYFPAGGQYITANGTYRVVCVASRDGSIGVNRVSGHTGSLQVDNFYVKEIPGNHASQATSTARGVVSARVNLLEKSEALSAPPWSPSGATVIDVYGISTITFGAGLGHMSQSIPSLSAAQNLGATFTIRTIANTNSRVLYWGGASAAGTDVVTITPLGGGEWLQTVARTFTSTLGGNPQFQINNSVIGNGAVVTVRACSFLLQQHATLPYQRVNTSTNYDAIGFPKYARLDGTDDFYTCGGGGSTTGFYYSDVVMPTTSTYSALLADNTGSGGYLVARTNTGIYFSANAGAAITSVSLPLAANVQAFVCVFDDGVNLVLQVNGAQNSIARPVVTAGSSTMYLCRYTTIAQYFSGQITEPIYRAGPPPSAYERGVIRAYQMQKAGML